MTARQIFLKAIYPLIMLKTKFFPHEKSTRYNRKNIPPTIPFYNLKAIANNGTEINFADFRGKKVLLVNTASNCGYTGQYADLQKLHESYKDKLVVLGFPANDFKEQEQGDDASIAEFCQVNFGVSFSLAKKSQVVKGPGQNPVFNWLTHSSINGWCDQQPLWNFNKYLIDEEGRLSGFFAHTVSPMEIQLIP